MTISLILARADNGVIGRDGGLPWRLKSDLRHFRAVTTGHPVLMGRKTFASIGRPLPGRTNIVVTHDRGLHAPGCVVVHSMAEAWKAAEGAEEACVIGGTTLFEESLPDADTIHLTEVEADVEGDTYFPDFDRSEWREIEVARHAADERHEYPFRIVRLERRLAAARR